jgi:DNA-binding protein Fis
MNHEPVDLIRIGGQTEALWLLLSIDKKLEPDQSYRLDDLFGLSPSEQESEEDREEREECRKSEDKFVKAMNRFLDTLDGLDANERYDAIVDEIDRFAKDADVTFLWGLVRAVSRDGDYAGNKRRALRHLCRKLGLENSVLPALENAAKTLAEVKKEREELAASDRPYREVVAALAALDLKEKETLDSLTRKPITLFLFR